MVVCFDLESGILGSVNLYQKIPPDPTVKNRFLTLHKMSNIQQLSFKDPEKVLAWLRWVEESLPLEDIPEKIRMLRTREMHPFLELRQAALFCFGLSSAMSTPVSFAMHENSDYDVISSFERDGKRLFAAIQLKEVVPHELNPEASLQAGLDKLRKYADSKDLIVAFHLNRRCTLDLNEIRPPVGVVAEIWIVSATNEAMTEWALIGNILNDECYTYRFTHPEAQRPAGIDWHL